MAAKMAFFFEEEHESQMSEKETFRAKFRQKKGKKMGNFFYKANFREL
jgi:hypothetical protein